MAHAGIAMSQLYVTFMQSGSTKSLDLTLPQHRPRYNEQSVLGVSGGLDIRPHHIIKGSTKTITYERGRSWVLTNYLFLSL